MSTMGAYLLGLAAMATLAGLTWVLAVARRDVSIVDSVWSLFFLLGGVVYLLSAGTASARASIVMALLSVWALRLAGYITWRNWGEGEDRRYVAIRERNQPNFAIKSLYLIFLLQAALAWFISQPLLAGMLSSAPLTILDAFAAGLVIVGIFFETVGDYQLARFKSDPQNAGKVMDKGLWRYTRHPNYFGDFCVWWGFYLFALAAGGWWTITGPILMSILLLRVSGVTLLEKDISERRPAYVDYIRRTNAFFPGPPSDRTAIATAKSYQES